MLHHLSQTHGLPLALYADHHAIFQNPKQATLAEQLSGQEPRTYVGRLLDELGIGLIPAYSPQANGRVKRLFQTLQDRLVRALRRAGATDAVHANAILPAVLTRFNQGFSQPPAFPGSAYRPALSLAEANARIHFTYWRTVASDHTVSLFGHVLVLPPLPARLNLAGRRFALHHRMDGRLAVVYGDLVLGLLQPAQLGPPRLEQFQPASHPLASPSPPAQQLPPTPLPTSIPADATPSPPGYDHPWRRQGRASFRRARSNNSSYGVIFTFPLRVSLSLITNSTSINWTGI